MTQGSISASNANVVKMIKVGWVWLSRVSLNGNMKDYIVAIDKMIYSHGDYISLANRTVCSLQSIMIISRQNEVTFISFVVLYSTTASKSAALQKQCLPSAPRSTCDKSHNGVMGHDKRMKIMIYFYYYYYFFVIA